MPDDADSNPLRRLPPVNEVLADAGLADFAARFGREAVVNAVRRAIDEARETIRSDGRGNRSLSAGLGFDASRLADRAGELLRSGERPLLRPVINATGILLHTGLGRAPLAHEAVDAVSAVAGGYCNLEFSLDEGTRGRRADGIARLLCELTGAPAATVVNNNAGATVLALRALAAGREVLVSRGQLIEIGGSFRLPEIMEVSGARLREVGTTNKTRLADYERAIGPETAAILRVHPSNYRIVGFTEEVPLAGLARLAHDRGLVMIDDIGSGALSPGCPPGILDEPTAVEGIAHGADVVLFSGDKLLGGPQCGVLVGTNHAIREIESDPLMRALRVDKMTLAALEATLRLIRQGRGTSIPTWAMLDEPLSRARLRAERFAASLRDRLGLNATVIDSESFVGGGSVPVQPIPSAAVAVGPPFPPPHGTEGEWARALRLGEPPVVARVKNGAVIFDLRTVPEREEASLLDSIVRSCHDRGDEG